MINEVVLIGSNTLGGSDEKLGLILMTNFIRLLGQRAEVPKFIILWNAGVKLVVEGADTLEFLKVLQDRGANIISCRTCVEYFDIENQIAAGKIDGMIRIQDVLANHSVLTV